MSEITVISPGSPAVVAKRGFMVIDNFDQAIKVADYLSQAVNCPTALKGKPHDMLMVLQKGAELGLHPTQAIECIAFINGKAAVYGDALLGICRYARNFEYIDETFDNETMTATCKAKRKDEPPVIRTFDINDAKTAQLWNKNQVWKAYPKRMLQMRARGFTVRDCFPDVLKGIITYEEAYDYPEIKPVSAPKVPLCDMTEADYIEDVEQQELTVGEIKTIVELFDCCTTVDMLRDKLIFIKSGYESRSIKAKINDLAMSVKNLKFKDEVKNGNGNGNGNEIGKPAEE